MSSYTQALLPGSGTAEKWASIHSREVKDLPFLLLLLLTIGGWIWVSLWAHGSADESWASAHRASSVVGHWVDSGIANLEQDSGVIAWTTLGAFGLSFVALLAIQYAVLPMIYTFFGLTVVGFTGAGISILSSANGDHVSQAGGALFLLGAVVVAAIAFLNRKRIKFTASVMSEASRGLQANPGVVVFGVALATAAFGLAIWWMRTVIDVFSVREQVNEDDHHGSDSKASAHADEYVRNSSARWLMTILVFVFFWVLAMLRGMLSHVTSGAVGKWYYSRREGTGGVGNNTLVAIHAMTYSLGSIAFGSLILAVVQTIRWLINSARKDAHTKSNPALRFILGCFACIFGCLEGLVESVSRFAYVHCAVKGHSFCEGAKASFALMSRSPMSIIFGDVLATLVLRCIKFVAVAIVAMTLAAYEHNGHSVHPVSITVAMGIAWGVISVCLHSVLAATDAVMVFFLEDTETSATTGEYHASPTFTAICEEKQRSFGERDVTAA